MSTPLVVLSIAGFDPSSGAGVTADLTVFAAHGCFGVSCVTALTVQSTRGVRAVRGVAAADVAATLACLEEDLPSAGIKIGMLGTAGVTGAVAVFLEGLGRRVPVVLDPVLRSSSGRELLDAAGLAVLRERLLPLVTAVTPNMDELGVLAGMRVDTLESMERAAFRLQRMFPGLAVVATGGHLAIPDDLLVELGGKISVVRGERVKSRATHGTGCAFSSALLCGLVSGMGMRGAAETAKAYVAEGIRRGPGVGTGQGPLDLLWPMRG